MSVGLNAFSMFSENDNRPDDYLSGLWGTVTYVNGRIITVNASSSQLTVRTLVNVSVGDTVFIVRSKTITGVAIGKL